MIFSLKTPHLVTSCWVAPFPKKWSRQSWSMITNFNIQNLSTLVAFLAKFAKERFRWKEENRVTFFGKSSSSRVVSIEPLMQKNQAGIFVDFPVWKPRSISINNVFGLFGPVKIRSQKERKTWFSQMLSSTKELLLVETFSERVKLVCCRSLSVVEACVEWSKSTCDKISSSSATF